MTGGDNRWQSRDEQKVRPVKYDPFYQIEEQKKPRGLAVILGLIAVLALGLLFKKLKDEESLDPVAEVEKSLRQDYQSPAKSSIKHLVSQKESPIDDLYVRLEIIDKEENQKKKQQIRQTQLDSVSKDFLEQVVTAEKVIPLDDVFKYQPQQRETKNHVLINGVAGVGKSTLCQNLAYRWAKGGLFPQFKFLFWIRLRRLDRKLYPHPITLVDFLHQEYGIDRKFLQTFLESPQLHSKTLIVLDGYDELPGTVTTQKEQDLGQILTTLKAFPNVLVTSRPQSIDFQPTRELKILGFDAKGIERYVSNFFKGHEENAKKLRTYLEKPLMRNLAHIPINLEILCSIVDQPNFTLSDTATMTTLYTELTNWLFRRFREKYGKTHDSRATIWEGNPRLANKVKYGLEALETIAWTAMEKNTLWLDQAIIEDKILKELNDKYKSKLNIGKMRYLGPLQIENREGMFIHLTFQEYFAAGHLARLYQTDPVKAQEIVKKIKFESRYEVLLCMAAGTLSEQPTLQQLFFNDLMGEPYELSENYELRLIARCFEECQQPGQLKQYPRFIQHIIGQLKQASMGSILAEIVYQNPKLMHHSEIENVVKEKLQNPTEFANLLNIIRRFIKRGESFPFAVKILQQMINNSDIDEKARGKAAESVGWLVKSGEPIQQKLLDDLMGLYHLSHQEETRMKVLQVIELIARSTNPSSSEAFSFLDSKALDYDLGEISLQAYVALSGIVASNKEFESKAIKTLVEELPYFLTDEDHKYDRNLFTSNLKARNPKIIAHVAVANLKLGRQLLQALVDIFNDPYGSYSFYVRRNAAYAIGKIAQSDEMIGEEAFSILLKLAKPLNSYPDDKLVGPFSELALSNSKNGNKALLFLKELALDSKLEIYKRRYYIALIAEVALFSKDKELPILNILIDFSSNPDFDQYDIYEMIVKVGSRSEMLSSQALKFLVDQYQLKQPNDRRRLLQIIGKGEITTLSKQVHEEVFNTLVQIASKDPEAYSILEELAVASEPLGKKVLQFLMEQASNIQVGYENQKKIYELITKVAIRSQNLGNEAFKFLIEIPSDPQKQKFNELRFFLLGKVAKSSPYVGAQALRFLLEKAQQMNKEAVGILGNVADSRDGYSAGSAEAFKGLLSLFENSRLPIDFRLSCLRALRSSIKQLDDKTVQAVVSIAANRRVDFLHRTPAVSLLGEIANSGKKLGPEALKVVAEIAREKGFGIEIRREAVKVLEILLQKNEKIGSAGLQGILEVASDRSIDEKFRKQAIPIVAEAIEIGENVDAESLQLLVKLASDPLQNLILRKKAGNLINALPDHQITNLKEKSPQQYINACELKGMVVTYSQEQGSQVKGQSITIPDSPEVQELVRKTKEWRG